MGARARTETPTGVPAELARSVARHSRADLRDLDRARRRCSDRLRLQSGQFGAVALPQCDDVRHLLHHALDGDRRTRAPPALVRDLHWPAVRVAGDDPVRSERQRWPRARHVRPTERARGVPVDVHGALRVVDARRSEVVPADLPARRDARRGTRDADDRLARRCDRGDLWPARGGDAGSKPHDRPAVALARARSGRPRT